MQGILGYLAIFVAFSSSIVSGKEGRTKSVIVSLDSKWPYTPILLEASEFIAKENNALFWRFVDSVAEKDPEELRKLTEQEVYEWISRLAEGLMPAARVDLMKFALSIRAHSPAVEMNRQIALTVANSNGLSIKDEKCRAFVDVHGQLLCLGGISESQLKEFITKHSGGDSSPMYITDHHYPGSKSASRRVVLYAQLGTALFQKAHGVLKRLAKAAEINYLLRHYSADSNIDKRRVRLSTYGVELAIKSTEYKAQDDSKIKANVSDDASFEVEEETDLGGFNFRDLKKLHPELKDGLNEFKLRLLEADELTPLKVWQLQDLSFQAGQRVVSAPKTDVLQVLQDLSQNFPMAARSLTRTVVKPEFRQEVEANQAKTYEDLGLQPGDAALFINGLVIDLDSFDLFQLLELLKKEEQLASGFFRMGFRREYLSLLTNLNPDVDTSNYAIDFRPAFPEFINNLDSDKEYKEWGNSVKLMVQPYFPGMIRPIARNFFTLIFIVDPSHPSSRSLLKIAFSFYAHQIPIRIGLIFVVNTDKGVSGMNDAGVAMLNLFQFVKADKDPAKALRMITELYDEVQENEIKSADVIRLFKKKYPDEDADLVFGANSDYDKGRQAGRQFLENSGLGTAPKVLLNGIPLDDNGISADRFEETVINEVMKITPKIQRDIMDGKLTDETNVYEYLMNRPEVMPRLNNRILRPKEPVYLDLTDVMEYKAEKVTEFSAFSDREANAYMVKNMRYLTRSEEQMGRPVTVWVLADLETKDGRDFFYDAMKHLKHSHKVRIGLIHNPKLPISDRRYSTAKIIQAVVQLLPLHQAKLVLNKILQSDTPIGEKLEDIDVHGVNWQLFQKEFVNMEDSLKNMMDIHSYYATNRLSFQPGQRGLVANGQIIGPLGEDEVFSTEDFNLLERYLCAKSADSVLEQIKSWEVPDEGGRSSDVVMRAAALVSGDTTTKKRRYWVALHGGDEHSGVTMPAADDTTSTFDIVAIVDPLSREAQKMAPLLSVLIKVVNADLKLMMNCKPKLSEMPLKSFYRLILQPQLDFDSKDGRVRAASATARFTSLPRKQLLTLNIIPPDAWLVEATKAIYDLDNIRMDQVDSDVIAGYELEHVLLEGHCFDEVTGNPPRGLQFVLGTQAQPYMVDTIVMANLGYFQLKANPGAWQLRLREGRSADIYDITTHDNTNSDPHSSVVTILIESFSGKIIRIRVAKKPDKINEHLLIDGKDEEQESIWSSISSKLTGRSDDSESTINIFTLASGHLYERFVRIMMVSVVKRATVPVKFWLLKNYLSPYFKKFLPYMAKHYNFSYELVQYRWPRWLHQQTEKQRIMWGYKLLFLDVLFPLSVRKIIFVDADQVVRADMKQLMDLDLEGAPYGYTPFCDSRTEMDGYRFWKRGYWANHLAGRRYHISALYVVDLKKFRQIAAGDRLRGQYQGLSSDPNSLSNLDQDLPNNMIHQVKIKSLPQEWLWCETWCDDKSKKQAKTIDLCNNPMTKEPKLESAMRIIDEWRDYDDEIRRVQETFDAEKAKATSTVKPDDTRETKQEKVDEHTEL